MGNALKVPMFSPANIEKGECKLGAPRRGRIGVPPGPPGAAHATAELPHTAH